METIDNQYWLSYQKERTCIGDSFTMNKSELSCAFLGYAYDDSVPAYNITLVSIAVLMLVLSLPTLFLNICIIIAILRGPELHTPSFAIIFNLAASDCLTGCSAYIFYATSCIRFVLGYDACVVANIGTPWSYILGITSFNTICLQTAERYIAIFYPYWYHEKLTVKRIILANLITWVWSAVMVTFWMITKNNSVFHGVVGILSLILFSMTVLCYVLIFREVRKIEREMMKSQTASYQDRRKIKSESKVAKATAIILAAVVACFSPLLFIELFIAFNGEQTTLVSIALYWGWFFALFNSFLNPFIACRQLTVLRRPVVEMLSYVLPCCRSREIMPLVSTTVLVLSDPGREFNTIRCKSVRQDSCQTFAL